MRARRQRLPAAVGRRGPARRAHPWRWLRLLAFAPLAAVTACGGGDPTAARVFFDLEAGVTIDQVRLQAEQGGVQLLSLDVPGIPTKPLQQGQDVVILFEDRLGGQKIVFLAAGLKAGAEVARGETNVTLARGQTRDTFVTLRLSAGCPAGQHGCGDACFPDDDADHCGLACLTCNGPAHGTPICAGNACSFACDPSFTRCGSECVDLRTDARNCNACARECQANQICQAGECLLNTCPDGQHGCDGGCVANLDPATCGSRCTPCPTPPNGTATCDGTTCGVSCNSGYHACGGSCLSNTSVDSCGVRCTPCPAAPNADVGCNGSSCTYTCKVGYHACGNSCVANSDPLTCGDRCTPCPAPPDHAVATCDGTSCGYSCLSGYVDCGGWCQVEGRPCDVCPPCGDGQYCYAAAGVCYTPGLCDKGGECPSGECYSGMCSCNMLPPTTGCRPHEQCLIQLCLPQP